MLFASCLTDFDFLEWVFERGFGFWVLEVTSEALKLLSSLSMPAATSPDRDSQILSASRVITQALRWLQQHAQSMRRDPRAVLQSAFAAPRGSALHAAAHAFHRKPAFRVHNPEPAWSDCLLSVPFDAEACCAAFSPDNSLLAAAAGNDARVLDAVTGRLVAELQAHGKAVTSLDWSADGLTIITGSLVRCTRGKISCVGFDTLFSQREPLLTPCLLLFLNIAKIGLHLEAVGHADRHRPLPSRRRPRSAGGGGHPRGSDGPLLPGRPACAHAGF